MKICCPVSTGTGAYIAHKSLEANIKGYTVVPYHPCWEFFPPGIRQFQQISADIVHAPVNYASFCRIKNRPLVSTFHGYVLDRFLHNYVSLSRRIHYHTDLKWFIQSALQHSSMVTCVSNFIAGLVREDAGYCGPLRVIYNGIDTEMFRPRKFNAGIVAPVRVLYCGGKSRLKGANLVPAILDSMKTDVQLFYTYGSRDDSFKIKHRNAQCLGHMPYSVMPELYNKVDVLLVPTVREGFGLVVAEAMACGLPVVATACSSMPELIDDGLGGYLCNLGNAESFAERLDMLAASPETASRMGEYNRQKTEELFTVSRMAGEYEALFEEILG